MNFERFATYLQLSTVALFVAVVCACTSSALAQDGHSHNAQQNDAMSSQAQNLVNVVRQATEKYKDVSVAEADGYAGAEEGEQHAGVVVMQEGERGESEQHEPAPGLHFQGGINLLQQPIAPALHGRNHIERASQGA